MKSFASDCDKSNTLQNSPGVDLELFQDDDLAVICDMADEDARWIEADPSAFVFVEEMR